MTIEILYTYRQVKGKSVQQKLLRKALKYDNIYQTQEMKFGNLALDIICRLAKRKRSL